MGKLAQHLPRTPPERAVSSNDGPPIEASKAALRSRAHTARRGQSDRSRASRLACERLEALAAYRAARVVAWYVSTADELETHDAVKRCARGKQVVIPFCEGPLLGLWSFGSFDELAPGTWGILEPPPAVRRGARLVMPASVDLLVVPGLAFDARGGRLGYGKGYYDGLLARARGDALPIGLGFECQVVQAVPMASHDMPMSLIVTEEQTYACQP